MAPAIVSLRDNAKLSSGHHQAWLVLLIDPIEGCHSVYHQMVAIRALLGATESVATARWLLLDDFCSMAVAR